MTGPVRSVQVRCRSLPLQAMVEACVAKLVIPSSPASSRNRSVITITDRLPWYRSPGVLVCDPLRPAQCRRALEGIRSGRVDAALLVGEAETQLPVVLWSVRMGLVSYSPDLATMAERCPPLSDRQDRVLLLVVAGLPYPGIGRRLNVSTATVKREVRELFSILDCGNRTQLALAAVDLGYV